MIPYKGFEDLRLLPKTQEAFVSGIQGLESRDLGLRDTAYLLDTKDHFYAKMHNKLGQSGL